MAHAINLQPISTPRGRRYVVRTDSQSLQALYGDKAAPCAVLQPRAQHLIYSKAPKTMGFSRPAQNVAAQP